ncbi:hypothetical protein [Kaistia sp. 32K]|uniref:hypothetical protein n=1 Tax=Kaistia sp. 32K TaxID=2795690 RepID=UPI001914E1A3|nr:hypothetical protein [Kaistia sp. 32K]
MRRSIVVSDFVGAVKMQSATRSQTNRKPTLAGLFTSAFAKPAAFLVPAHNAFMTPAGLFTGAGTKAAHGFVTAFGSPCVSLCARFE